MFSNFFFKKLCHWWDDVKKCSRARQPQMIIWCLHIALLDTWGNKCTHRLCNTHSFSIATMVALTRLSVTLYVHCLSCFCFCAGYLCSCKLWFCEEVIVHVMSYMEAHCSRLQVQYRRIARNYPPEGCYYQLLKWMNENILLSVVMFHRMGTFLFTDLWITNNFISVIKKKWHRILLVWLPKLCYENQEYAHCF